MTFGDSLHRRLRTLKQLASRRALSGPAGHVTKAERDAEIQLALSRPEARTAALAVLQTGDKQSLAVVEAAFRADT